MNYSQRKMDYYTNYSTIQQVRSWVQNQNLLAKVWLAIFFAGLTGLFAQLRIYLPWTPIPITLQTVAVVMSGLVLGKIFGLFSQILYLLIGFLGVPWFANQQGGFAIVLGPTAGYLVGFLFASFVSGWFSEKFSRKKSNSWLFLAIMLLINFTAIYIPGLIHLYLWVSISSSTAISMVNLFLMGFIPFVLGDIIKITFITIIHSNISEAW
ncbi:MAG: biotin transporter BioY [Candidatus Heimdallarchaeota archaeon]